MTPTDAEITELPSSPGARLRREREARGFTEQQAAESLNLDPSVISILESNDFGALGAPVFVKGHLRRYATLLGLNEDEIVGAYERSKQHLGEPTLVPKSRLEMAPVRGRPRWPLVVGGAAVFLLAAALLAYLSEHGLPWSKTADEPALDEQAVPAASGPSATGEASTANDAGATAPTAEGPAAAAQPASGTGSATVPPAAAPGSASTSPPATGGTAAPATAATQGSAAPAPAVPPGPGQVSLQLRFSADSWVEIFDGSGKAVLYDLGKTGSERTVTATAPLSVTLGNAPGVAIAVNGRALPPPPSQGSVARFSVGPDGTLR